MYSVSMLSLHIEFSNSVMWYTHGCPAYVKLLMFYVSSMHSYSNLCIRQPCIINVLVVLVLCVVQTLECIHTLRI